MMIESNMRTTRFVDRALRWAILIFASFSSLLVVMDPLAGLCSSNNGSKLLKKLSLSAIDNALEPK